MCREVGSPEVEIWDGLTGRMKVSGGSAEGFRVAVRSEVGGVMIMGVGVVVGPDCSAAEGWFKASKLFLVEGASGE